MRRLIVCRKCNGRNHVYAGKTKIGKQLYKCKDCGSRFIQRKLSYRLRYSLKFIADALYTWVKKFSLRETRDYLYRKYQLWVSHRAIKSWIDKFSPKMKEFCEQLRPKLSGLWHMDEMYLMWNVRDPRNKHKVISRETHYTWNTFDAESRYVFYPLFSMERDPGYPARVLRKAIDVAKSVPQCIASDSFYGYKWALKVLGKNAKHIKFNILKGEKGNNVLERFHSTVRTRSRLLRGYRPKGASASLVYLIYTHYNFLRIHSAIGKTPADAAGIHLNISPDEKGLLRLLRRALAYELRISSKGST